MKYKKLYIENLHKIEGEKIGSDYIVSKVAIQMHWILIYLTDSINNTIEVRIKRDSDNNFKPYRWTMKNGNTVRPMYKKDFETPNIFLMQLDDFVAPLPF